MIEDFISWLEGIVEDDPIPYEIKHICFIYTCYDKSFSLEVGGTELKPNLNNIFDYYPLEAQFFNCKQLNSIQNKEHYIKLIKYIIDESFSSDFLRQQYKSKHIYLSEMGKNPEFLFDI